MPKQAFKFTDEEVTRILYDYMSKNGMLPMAKYDLKAMVSFVPGTTGFTITIDVEKTVDKIKGS
jgi:hypothetical protein